MGMKNWLALPLFVGVAFFGWAVDPNPFVTGVVINDGRIDPETLQTVFPNLHEIEYNGVDMRSVDLGRLDYRIKTVTFTHCTGTGLYFSKSNLGISTLSISASGLTQLTKDDFSRLEYLENLVVSSCPVQQVEFGTTGLKTVYFFDTKVKDFLGLDKLYNLLDLTINEFGLEGNFSIDGIEKLDKLVSLDLSANFTLSSPENIPSVRAAYIKSVSSSSASFDLLKRFTALTDLTIHGGSLDHFPAELSGLKKLKRLALLAIPITEFPQDLSDFESLVTLDFEVYEKVKVPPNITFPSRFKTLIFQSEGDDLRSLREQYPAVEIRQGQM
jgi:hypothetical protein